MSLFSFPNMELAFCLFIVLLYYFSSYLLFSRPHQNKVLIDGGIRSVTLIFFFLRGSQGFGET